MNRYGEPARGLSFMDTKLRALMPITDKRRARFFEILSRRPDP